MKTTVNHPLPIEKFKTLADNRYLHSVSAYLPMHKTGKEQNEHLAQANLKYCMKEVHRILAKHQIKENEIKNYLNPINDLVTNIALWRNPSDGLAIFLNNEGLNYYTFSIPFTTHTYVADHFYLKPLLSLYHEDGIYYLLELSEDHVKLYECSRYGCKDLFIEDLAPNQLEKAVGFDYKSKMLQFRSGHAAYSAGSFHGHGEGKEDYKHEMEAFFRAIDAGVKQLITDRNAPLVLACIKPLHAIYKVVSSYPNIYEKYISGDPEFTNKKKMHEQSWKLVQDHFKKNKKSKLELFTELYHTPKTSYDASEIITAAIYGKIDTLFVEKGRDLFGVYNKVNNQIRFDESKDLANVSLLNLAAMQTFLQKGKVYELVPKEMPVKVEPLNAIFRY